MLFFSFLHPYNLDIGKFEVVKEVPKSLFIFLNSFFFILFWLDVYFFLLFQILPVSPGFLPVTVDSLNVLLYFTLGVFLFSFSFIFQPSSIISVSILITRALNSPSDRLAISSLLSSLSEVLLYSFIWALFLCDSLSFLVFLKLYFLCQIEEVLLHYLFK